MVREVGMGGTVNFDDDGNKQDLPETTALPNTAVSGASRVINPAAVTEGAEYPFTDTEAALIFAGTKATGGKKFTARFLRK